MTESVLPPPPDPARFLDLTDGQGPLLERVIATLRVLLGPVTEDVAQHCHDLAGLVGAHGDVELAGLLYERALAVKQEFLGPDHPGVAATLHNLALLRQAEGRVEEADVLWNQARTAVEAGHGRT
jgi:hypothetical protein